MTEKGRQDGDAVEKAKEALAKAVARGGSLHFEACVRCGMCGETCHIWLAEPVPENLPASKAAKVVSHFRRYHTFLGRAFPAFVGARPFDSDALKELAEAVYGRCTGCGRCGLHCTVGLDVAAIIRAGRNVVAAAGPLPEDLARTVRNQIETGNQMAIPREELRSTAEWLTDDLRTEMGDETVRVHVDDEEADVLYLINPREVKFFPLSLMAAAGVFHRAGLSWTLSSLVYDVTNYAFYSGDDDAARELTRRVVEEAKARGVKEVVLSECGHGFRSFRWEGPDWTGEAYPFRMRSVLEVLEEFLDGGKIDVDPEKNPDRVTLHDPCNLVRWGGVVEPQRRILRKTVREFVEMAPNRADNYCCGGGGGMLSMSEYGERRSASGRTKADQIRATGAKVVATPCHNCADQLLDLNKKYGLGVEILSLVEIVYNALA